MYGRWYNISRKGYCAGVKGRCGDDTAISQGTKKANPDRCEHAEGFFLG
jgi:hypothetical protein